MSVLADLTIDTCGSFDMFVHAAMEQLKSITTVRPQYGKQTVHKLRSLVVVLAMALESANATVGDIVDYVQKLNSNPFMYCFSETFDNQVGDIDLVKVFGKHAPFIEAKFLNIK